MIRNLLSRFTRQAPAEAVAPTPARRGISAMALANSRARAESEAVQIAPYEPPAGVVPAGLMSQAMAMDSTPYDWVNTVFAGAHFKGFPYLAMLSQYPEYRKMSETIAKQMTRTWIKVRATGETDKSDKVKAMEDALKEFHVQDLFRKAAELDGFFGRGQIYIDVKTPSGIVAQADPEELKTPLLRSPAKIKKDSLIGFKVVEPVWTYPNAYNSSNPLAPDYYKPTSWFVMGNTVHASRLLLFVSREVPDMLKASYNFGGLSLSQLAEPYVNNWIRTRDSLSDLVHSFSISGIKTNMGSVLAGADGAEMLKRAELFNNLRDSRGLMLMDMDTEEFFQFNTPLSGLDALQSQAQEQMASVSNIPLVYLLGITPQGLNATSEGEISVFAEYILSMQEAIFTGNLKRVFEIIQLSKFGEIDPDIGFEYEPLAQMDPVELATIRKTDADTDAVLIGAGVISSDEARERIASDPATGYHSLDLNVAPDGADDDPTDDDA
jgi:phage-related protein (TIGR01555 family)